MDMPSAETACTFGRIMIMVAPVNEEYLSFSTEPGQRPSKEKLTAMEWSEAPISCSPEDVVNICGSFQATRNQYALWHPASQMRSSPVH